MNLPIKARDIGDLTREYEYADGTKEYWSGGSRSWRNNNPGNIRDFNIPTNSRYVPMRQQPYCCVPACIYVVMHRLGLPLMPQELLGYHLGLTVPPESASDFFNPRVSDKPPSAAGYGTQIHMPEFEPNAVFEKLTIRLRMERKLVDQSDGYDGLLKFEDITEQVLDSYQYIQGLIENAGNTVVGEEPLILTGPQCKKPHPCPFQDYCNATRPEYPIESLPRSAKILDALRQEGIEAIEDIPENWLTNEIHQRVRRTVISGEAEIDQELVAFLQELSYPRFYLDFEAYEKSIHYIDR